MIDLRLGDCLDVMGDIAGGSIDLIACDLPYQVTACRWDVMIPFEPLWAHYRRLLKPRGAVVLTASQPFTSMLVMSNREWFRFDYVWDKAQPTGHLNAMRRPLRRHESVLVFSPSAMTYNPQMGVGIPKKRTPAGKQAGVYGKFDSLGTPSDGTRYPTSVISISTGRSPNNRTVLPTQKPVALMEYLIHTYTNEGETVLDSCMGSGTTLIACLNTGRYGIGIEKDHTIFAIAERRIAAEIAKHPLLSAVADSG